MKFRNAFTPLLLLAGGLASCQVPTALQGSQPWPFGGHDRQPRDYWQTEGRFRQQPGPNEPAGPGAGSPTTLFESDPLGEALDLEPPLLSWDGGVVAGSPQGVVSESSEPGHGIEPTVEGRMHIIELYQEVLDERDGLIRELETLSAAFETTQNLLERSLQERSELEQRISGLETSRDAMTAENRELSARLTTAQIRRLEAERLLLESRIGWHRRLGGLSDEAPASRVAGGGQ